MMITKIKIWLLVLSTGLVASVEPVRAHHSFPAQYDDSKPVTLTGAVTEVQWTNPHIFIYIDVTDEESGEAYDPGAFFSFPTHKSL